MKNKRIYFTTLSEFQTLKGFLLFKFTLKVPQNICKTMESFQCLLSN